MQIGAINSVNFGNYRRDFDEPIDVDFEVVNEDTQRGGIDEFIGDVNKANNDVSPISCILGVVAGLIAIKNGSKAIGLIRNAIATGAEGIANGAVKVASKAKKSIDTTKASEKITSFCNKFRGISEVNDEKLTQKVAGVVDSIFGREVVIDGQVEKITKSKGFIETLNKHGIFVNKKSLFDNGLALALGWGAADVASDVAEDSIDSRNIKNSALRNLSMYKNTAEALINGLTQ